MSTVPTNVAPATPVSRGLPDGVRRVIRKFGAVFALVAVFALFTVLQPQTFPTADNLQIMALQTAVVGTAALGMTLIIIAGGIDLSVGSQIALTTVATAIVLSHFANGEADVPARSALVAAVAGVAVAGLCGLLIGLLVTGLGLAPFIVTLGTWGALRGAAKGVAHENTIEAPNSWLNTLLQSVGPGQRWMLVPAGVWLMLALALLVGGILHYTRFGRHVFAIGSNEQTARLCGVPVVRTKIFVYTLGALFAGVAGVLQFAYLTMGDPTTATGYELDVIAAVVIGGASLNGGQGSVLGTLIGAFIMTVVRNGCTKMGYANWVQEIVTGGIIVAAVALDRLRHRRSG